MDWELGPGYPTLLWIGEKTRAREAPIIWGWLWTDWQQGNRAERVPPKIAPVFGRHQNQPTRIVLSQTTAEFPR